MNKNTIMGLKMIQEGISLILDNAEQEASVPVEAVEETAVETKTAKKTAPVAKTAKSAKVEAKPTSSDSGYTQEELDGMTYNDLKKLAKELGITAVGNRKEITAKILSGETSTEEEPEETEEKKPSKKTVASKSKPVKKSAPPVEEDDDDEEPEDIEDDDEEPEDDVDPVEQQVLEAVEDMEDDEIRDLLSDVGISAKGKRQALISKLVQAVKDGKIDFDDNDSDENEDEDDSSDESVEEDSADEDITEGMNKKRKKAYIQFCKETEESFNDGEITREEMIEFINDFNGTKDKMKKVSDEDILNTYLTLASNLISDDGEIVEEGAYTVNDEPYCCGKPLKYDEDENKFICETCGEEYEGEE